MKALQQSVAAWLYLQIRFVFQLENVGFVVSTVTPQLRRALSLLGS